MCGGVGAEKKYRIQTTVLAGGGRGGLRGIVQLHCRSWCGVKGVLCVVLVSAAYYPSLYFSEILSNCQIVMDSGG